MRQWVRDVAIFVGIGTVLLAGAAMAATGLRGDCTHLYNGALQRYETACPDGSRSITRWNNALQRWEVEIIRSPIQPRQHRKEHKHGR